VTLSRASNAALKQDDVVAPLRRIGIEPVGGSPEDFARYIDAEVKKATAVAVTAGLRKSR
jgi:tripartite-type tricarboxylate transporter receptor subunit TctC